MIKAETMPGNWNGQWSEWTPDISVVSWRIIDKLKLDNLPCILRAGSIDPDSQTFILPWCHFMFWLASGQALFRDFVGWDGPEHLSQGRWPHLWSCRRLLSFQHPPFPDGTLKCGELYWISTTPTAGNTISFVRTVGKILSRASQQWTLTSEEGVLEGGIRLCKTIFRWESGKVSFSSLSQSSHPSDGKINLLRKERTCRFIFLLLVLFLLLFFLYFFFFFSFLVTKTEQNHRRQHNISELPWIGLCSVHQSFTQPDTGSCWGLTLLGGNAISTNGVGNSQKI